MFPNFIKQNHLALFCIYLAVKLPACRLYLCVLMVEYSFQHAGVCEKLCDSTQAQSVHYIIVDSREPNARGKAWYRLARASFNVFMKTKHWIILQLL